MTVWVRSLTRKSKDLEEDSEILRPSGVDPLSLMVNGICRPLVSYRRCPGWNPLSETYSILVRSQQEIWVSPLPAGPVF